MEQKTFSIPSISCGHCVNAIKSELTELEGVSKVEGNVEGKSVLDLDAVFSNSRLKLPAFCDH